MGEKIEYKGYTIEIEQDQDAESPREWSNAAVLVLSHRRYDLPHEADINNDAVHSIEEFITHVVDKHDARFFFPVWGYDHSQLVFKAGERTYPFNDPWDSGFAGLAFITNATIAEHFPTGFEPSDQYPTLDAWAKAVVDGEIETYNQWATGDVWVFTIYNAQGAVVDSCGGLFGFDYALEEAKAAVD
jgi:hypothetical protein